MMDRMLKKIANFETDCEVWLKMQSLDELLANQSQISFIEKAHKEIQSPLLNSYKLENEPMQSKRATRVLIALIDQIPMKLVEEISPRSINFKRWLKAPMVLLIWSTAIFAG